MWFLVRGLQLPNLAVFKQARWLTGLPSASVDEELKLMVDHEITHLVTKNAGGPAIAKLHAAAKSGVQIVVVERPILPEATTVETIQQAVDWLTRVNA